MPYHVYGPQHALYPRRSIIHFCLALDWLQRLVHCYCHALLPDIFYVVHTAMLPAQYPSCEPLATQKSRQEERRKLNSINMNWCLKARRIHSILCYAPTPAHVHAHFGFIQCGSEMVVTLTADARLFVEPDCLLVYFQVQSLFLCFPHQIMYTVRSAQSTATVISTLAHRTTGNLPTTHTAQSAGIAYCNAVCIR